MTAIQSNKLAMYIAVRVFLTGFLNSPTATSLFPALAAKLATLVILINKIIAHASTQDAPLDAVIRAREAALNKATTRALAVAGAVVSYARTQKQVELETEMSVSASSFRSLRRAERMRLAQRIHAVALPLQAQLADYGLTAAKIAELQAFITAADDTVAARATVSADKKVATGEIDRLCAETDALLAEIDPMLVQLGESDPETHARFRAARVVFDRPGTRSQEVDATAASNPANPSSPTASSAEKPAA
jgi:hypothetical protein